MRQIVRVSWSIAQQEALIRGLYALRNASFFAAHEVFEQAWREADGPTRPVLKALAQLSASHHQLLLGRGRAAVRTWLKARDPLLAVGAVDVAFCDAMNDLHARAGATADGPRHVDPSRCGRPQDFPKLDPDKLYTASA